MYDKNIVKSHCHGRWIDILTSLGGISPDLLQDDKKKHPCPKCGSDKNSFRFAFPEDGGCICSQCFDSKNADGFATLQWITGQDFQTVLQQVGDFVNAPTQPGKGKSKSKPKTLFLDGFDEYKAKLWCMNQDGCTPEGLEAAGAQFGTHKFFGQSIPVVALQHHNTKGSKGWTMFALSGRPMPSKDDTPKKTKVMFGSERGMMGQFDRIADADIVIKVEGPKDLIAALSMPNQPGNVAVVSNSNGARENPVEQPWFNKAIKDKDVIIIHDCDEPGQYGATESKSNRPGWTLVASRHANTAKNVILPYEITKGSGKDLRDWIIEFGGTWSKLLEYCEKFEPTRESEVQIIREVNDPDFLAEKNIRYYETEVKGRLMHWSSTWWKYKLGKWRLISNSEIEKKVTKRIRIIFEEDYRQKIEDGEDVKSCKSISASLVTNVMRSMASMCNPLPDSAEQPCYIPSRSKMNWLSFANGILDLDDLVKENIEDIDVDNLLKPHTSDWFSPVKLNYDFDPDAECPMWVNFLDSVMEGDHERIELLQQWAGYLLVPGNERQKFLIIEGPGGNGKSVFFAGILAMLGSENVSNVSLEGFDSRFDLAQTIGKMANIAGDINEVKNVAEGKLKLFTGKSPVFFDRKGMPGIDAVPTAKFMGGWNNRPHIKDQSNGIWRRMILIPFDRETPESEKVLAMDSSEFWHRKNEVSGILNWAIEGLLKLQISGDFVKPEACRLALEDYRTDTSLTRQFINEVVVLSENFEDVVKSQDLYDRFRKFCTDCGSKNPIGRNRFLTEFKNVTGIELRQYKSGGVNVRGFKGMRINDSEGSELWP